MKEQLSVDPRMLENNWQQPSNFDKNIEINATVRRTTSSHKKGKGNDWKAKTASGTNPGLPSRVLTKARRLLPSPTTGLERNIKGAAD